MGHLGGFNMGHLEQFNMGQLGGFNMGYLGRFNMGHLGGMCADGELWPEHNGISLKGQEETDWIHWADSFDMFDKSQERLNQFGGSFKLIIIMNFFIFNQITHTK